MPVIKREWPDPTDFSPAWWLTGPIFFLYSLTYFLWHRKLSLTQTAKYLLPSLVLGIAYSIHQLWTTSAADFISGWTLMMGIIAAVACLIDTRLSLKQRVIKISIISAITYGLYYHANSFVVSHLANINLFSSNNILFSDTSGLLLLAFWSSFYIVNWLKCEIFLPFYRLGRKGYIGVQYAQNPHRYQRYIKFLLAPTLLIGSSVLDALHMISFTASLLMTVGFLVAYNFSQYLYLKKNKELSPVPTTEPTLIKHSVEETATMLGHVLGVPPANSLLLGSTEGIAHGRDGAKARVSFSNIIISGIEKASNHDSLFKLSMAVQNPASQTTSTTNSADSKKQAITTTTDSKDVASSPIPSTCTVQEACKDFLKEIFSDLSYSGPSRPKLLDLSSHFHAMNLITWGRTAIFANRGSGLNYYTYKICNRKSDETLQQEGLSSMAPYLDSWGATLWNRHATFSILDALEKRRMPGMAYYAGKQQIQKLGICAMASLKGCILPAIMLFHLQVLLENVEITAEDDYIKYRSALKNPDLILPFELLDQTLPREQRLSILIDFVNDPKNQLDSLSKTLKPNGSSFDPGKLNSFMNALDQIEPQSQAFYKTITLAIRTAEIEKYIAMANIDNNAFEQDLGCYALASYITAHHGQHRFGTGNLRQAKMDKEKALVEYIWTHLNGPARRKILENIDIREVRILLGEMTGTLLDSKEKKLSKLSHYLVRMEFSSAPPSDSKILSVDNPTNSSNTPSESHI